MYKTKEIKDRKSGFRYQRASILKRIPISDDDIFVEIKGGESLSFLAYKYYGSDKYWRIIAQANRLHTNFPKIGTVVRIPQSPTLNFIKE